MNQGLYSEKRFSIKKMSDETLIYDEANDNTHFLNPAAIKILELAYDGKKIEEIESSLREEFNIGESEDIKKDIEEAIENLKKRALI